MLLKDFYCKMQWSKHCTSFKSKLQFNNLANVDWSRNSFHNSRSIYILEQLESDLTDGQFLGPCILEGKLVFSLELKTRKRKWENTVRRICEYCVFHITNAENVFQITSRRRVIWKAFFGMSDVENSIITFPTSLYSHCWKIQPGN